MEEKTLYSDTNLIIEPLSKAEDLSDFTCGNNILDDFFHKEVVLCCRFKYLSAYSVKDKNTNQVLCLFTLANDVITLDEEDVDELNSYISDEYRVIFEQQTSFPAVNIGHLATRVDYQGLGIGSFVIKYIMAMMLEHKTTGVQFLTVDSLNNPKTNKFYMQNGFLHQTHEDSTFETRRMFCSLIEYIE